MNAQRQVRPGRRVSANDLGFHALPRRLLVAHAGLLVAVVAAGAAAGISVGGGIEGWARHAGPALLMLLFWLAHYLQPGKRSSEWWIAESVLAFGLMTLGTAILAPAQYIAASLDRPLADSWFAMADESLGLHVPSLVAWTKMHPVVNGIMLTAYRSLLFQLILVVAIVWWTRDRHALWEYVVTYHITAVVTVVASALWPAAGAFTYYGFTSTLTQARFIDHFARLRDGTMTAVPLGDIEGLISMPSFHVIGGLLLAWALRRSRVAIPIACLNALMILSTVMTGAHYAVDVLGALVTWAIAVVLYSKYCAHLVPAFRGDEHSTLGKTAGTGVADLVNGSGAVRAAGEDHGARTPEGGAPAGALQAGNDRPALWKPDPVGS